MPDALGLSYRSVKELNDLIDHKMPGRPLFRRKDVIIGQERVEFYYRDVLECIRSLFGDPQYAEDLVFAPERHYTTHERKSRLYHEMYTCDWWWTIQVRKLDLIYSFTDWVKRKSLNRAELGRRSSLSSFRPTRRN